VSSAYRNTGQLKMQLDDAATELLKKWIITKLENISDADSDVLADYVLALVKTDEPEPVARANCIENLSDFLHGATEPFVVELFQAISTKSYDPNRPKLKPAAAVYQPLKRSSAATPRTSNDSRKRSYRHDGDHDHTANGNAWTQAYEGEDRPFKQAKRGGRGRDQRGARQAQPPPQPYGLPQDMLQTPPFQAGLPPLDPNDPMAAMFMQQAMSFFMQNGGLSANGGAPGAISHKQRCWDYDNKGACSYGMNCPFEHGEDSIFVPSNQEYDPKYATLLNIEPTRVGSVDVSRGERSRGRGRGRGRGNGSWRGGGKRSEFSFLGPDHDMSHTKIVVEQIPEDKCDEHTVQEFFEQFGYVEALEMHSHDRLAIISFDSHDSAQAAYDSPEAIFGNRFVKVYWYKHEKHKNLLNGTSGPSGGNAELQDVEMGDNEHMDTEEFAKHQAEVQRKHEEATKQREETAKQKQDVSTKLAEMEAERRKVEAMLTAKKAGKSIKVEDDGYENAQAKTLKAHLAQLEAEAKSLGIDPDAASTNGFNSYPSYRGRGGYRGRGRGRGSFRGYEGGWSRGGGRGGRGGAGAVMRLDNRPKTVAVTFADGTFDSHDEAIRQYLLFSSLDSAALSEHPERDDIALIAFNERYEGEMFMAAASRSELPHVGKVELSWYKPDTAATIPRGSHEANHDKVVIHQASEPPSPEMLASEAAYDVADEDLDRFS